MYSSPEERTQSQDTWFNHTCVELYLHPSRVVFLQTYPQFLHCILLFKIITMHLVRLRGQTARRLYLPIITVYLCNLAQSVHHRIEPYHHWVPEFCCPFLLFSQIKL